MLMGMYSHIRGVSVKIRHGVVVHTSVGFCVARSTVMGNAKASSSGTGDGCSRFFML